MTVNSNGDYEALAKLLYPSIEASGNVYYGQTRKLTLDEVFDKNNGGFESHIESRKVTDATADYGFRYEKFFCWKIGSLRGEINIDNIRLDSYPLYYAKYLITKDIVSETNVLNSGEYSSYHFDVSTTIKEIFYHSGRNPTDDTEWDGKKFYIVNDNGIYYMYIPIINGAENDLLHEDYDQNNPLKFTVSNGVCELFIDIFCDGTPDASSYVNEVYSYITESGVSGNFVIHNNNSLVRLNSSGADYGRWVKIWLASGSTKGTHARAYGVQFVLNNANEQNVGYLSASGDIRSLQIDKTSLISCEFCKLFSSLGDKLLTPPELPCTSLNSYCYESMFQSCTNLMFAPKLPATELAESCYSSMFQGCHSLVSMPALPALSLESECYYNMFFNCTGLKVAKDLPATSLANECYYEMFRGCVSLKSSPYLPADTLVNDCYVGMFWNCSSMTSLYCYADCDVTNTNSMLSDVHVNGVVHTSSSSDWEADDYYGTPSTWNVSRDFNLKWEF